MLSRKDVAILGMMIFSLFLGAGNIIFPPMEGYQAGNLWFWGALGFLLTGVIMPFITLIVVTLNGRGEELSIDLPKWAHIAFWSILYLVIGSTFAMPRVTNVAYEMAWKPLELISGEYSHIIFAIIFNLVGMSFMLGRSTMISSIGKFMAPALLLLLIVVAYQVISTPLSPIVAPSNAYQDHFAVATGLISGYQTMDVLSAMAFGGIVARALSSRGISDKKAIINYTLTAGAVSVVLLSLLYFCLFYLGATGEQVAKTSSNGGQLFAQYVNVLFGQKGSWIMSGIVLLASLTTLVGVTSACADYFSKFHPRLNYTFFVIIFTISTIIISETGLNKLLRITIPALLLIYPIAIMLVIMQLLRTKIKINQSKYRLIIGTTALFSITDSLKNMELLPQAIQSILNEIPLHQEGLTWLLPTLLVILMGILLDSRFNPFNKK